MPSDRLEALKSILARNPGDSLARYGLAMEYIKAGQFEEAVAEFGRLLSVNPDLPYACFHAAQTLEKLSRPADAKEMYRRGLDVAVRLGNAHARDELQAALDQLG